MSPPAGAEPSPLASRKPRLHRTSFGALALTAASSLRLLLQLALLPILARLVGPAEYGLVALAMPFILLANVLSDGGMGYALGRRAQASRELESTVFWLTAGLGAALALACCLAALPMGAILQQPRLPALIMALSPILFMNGLTAVSNGRIIREGRFAVFAVGDVISTVLGAATALAAAMNGWGAWSLVAQQLVLWGAKLVWVTVNGRAEIGFHCRFEEARGLLAFGGSTIGAILADFVARNLDSLIVGGVLGVSALGYYAMAYQIVRAPDMLISGPLYLYIFTAVARAAGDPSGQSARVLAIAGLRLGAVALAPLFCGLALVADLAVALVLGPKWLGSVGALQFLAIAGFFFCMFSILSTTAMGLGRSRLQLGMSIILAIVCVLVVAVSVRFGLRAVAAALAAGIAGVWALYVVRLARDLTLPAPRLLAALAPAATATAVMAAVALATRMLLGQELALVVFGATVATAAISYGAVIFVFRGQLLQDARAFASAQSDGPPPAADAAPRLQGAA
ncbi:MAG: oligosaccharide flippase family protein [Phenylobacterium sp.]|uniref:oligosaccharide flippase family protein n=1 Tax=Phenylobacterium sp. TaxID=1871053 RepID=UPI0027319457|nr:oligosaccharide flippase family protein [Phenylobacterium sp.]MDP2008972.1 oligosaccharide flippase family protein [Phenylobacterium sp.]